jgi:hypothetical protein
MSTGNATLRPGGSLTVAATHAIIAAVLTAIRRVPATAAVALFYLVLVVSALLLQEDASEIVAVAMLALLAVCCCLRRGRRLEVLLCAMAPGGFGTLLHDVTGVSPAWGMALIPLLFAQLVSIDREDRREHQTASPSAA